MKHTINEYVTIAYVQFKANAPWRPRTFTEKMCIISSKRNDEKVKAFATATAERWKKQLEDNHNELHLTYTIKVETIGVAGIDVLQGLLHSQYPKLLDILHDRQVRSICYSLAICVVCFPGFYGHRTTDRWRTR